MEELLLILITKKVLYVHMGTSFLLSSASQASWWVLPC